jgi:hypothetical protein
MPWNQDPNMLSAIGSLSAVLISVIALLLSYRGQAAQQLREKREELRGVLERLVSLREEQNVLNKEQDEAVRAQAGAYQNTKRIIYLEAAESLARQISRHVNASEYYVLGVENFWDSDFVEAMTYYEMAVKRSRHSSAIRQAEILRTLAALYFIQDPAVQNHDKGRRNYEKAVRVIKNRDDNYSIYTQALTYRNWAMSELGVKNLSKTDELLKHALSEWMKLPAATSVGWTADLRLIAYNWGYLGTAYFQAREDEANYIEKGRLAFQEALKVAEVLSSRYGIKNDYTIDTRGLIFQWWGQQECAAGSRDESHQLLIQAEHEFQSLSDNFAWKNLHLAELQQAQSQIALGKTQIDPSLQEVPLGGEELSRAPLSTS